VNGAVVLETPSRISSERHTSRAAAAECHRTRVVGWRTVWRAIGLIVDAVAIKIQQELVERSVSA
jgi:hypothetical protein